MNIFIICDSFIVRDNKKYISHCKIRIFVISSLQKRVFFLLKYAKNLCLIAEEIKKVTFDTTFSPIV